MAAEEAVLYPAIDRLDRHDATVTLRRDHDQIRRYTTQIADTVLDAANTSDDDLRAALYGLDAVVHLHLANEESFYPLLDRDLDDAAALTIITDMQRAKHHDHGDPAAAP